MVYIAYYTELNLQVCKFTEIANRGQTNTRMAVLLSPKGCQLLPPWTISLMSQIAQSHVIFWKAWNPHWKRVSMKSISDKKEGSGTSTRLLFVFCLGGWPCCTSYITADVLTHIHNLFCKVTLKKLQILNSSYSMFFQVIQNKIVLSAFLSCICIHCFGIFTDLAISTCLQSVVNLTPLAFFNSLDQLIDELVVYGMYVVYCTVLCYIGFALNDSNATLERYLLWQ